MNKNHYYNAVYYESRVHQAADKKLKKEFFDE